MEFDGEVIGFNIFDTMKFPQEAHTCFAIDTVDTLALKFQEALDLEELEVILTQGVGISDKGHRIPLEELVMKYSDVIMETVSALES